MDRISKAIKAELYLTKRQKLLNQSWDEFNVVSESKLVFVWGVSAILEVFFQREIVPDIEGIIDNNIMKQGHVVSDFVSCTPEISDLIIHSKEILSQYKTSDVVVLIASSNYYESIIDELEELGVKDYFSLLHMEYNRRKELPDSEKRAEDSFKAKIEEIISKNKIQQNKIVVSGLGTYSNHEKYIIEQLLKFRDDLDIVLIVNSLDKELPKGIRCVFSGNVSKCTFELETAKVWISSTMMPERIIKREGQIYFYVKHWASITLKKFYLDAPSVRNVPGNEKWWVDNSKKMDYIIVGSDFDAVSCRRGLSNKAKMLYFGSPRSDILFHSVDCRQKICRLYGLDERKPILLYAPTYRFKEVDKGEETPILGNIELNYGLLQEALEKKFETEWTVLLRLHPSLRLQGKELAEKEGLIDASEYEDSQELVAACDMMISDYSSIMFEPAFVKKPVFLFAPDRESYIDHEYELLIDYDSLPFPIATTNEQLAEYISNFDRRYYEARLTDFFNKYGVHEDGHASERAAEFILHVMD